MSTSISKNINHPPLVLIHTLLILHLNVLLSGRKDFCSILFTSQKPEKMGKPHCGRPLGTPENSELMLFYCFLSFLKKKKKRTNVNFRGSGGEKKKQLKLAGPRLLD